MIRNTLTRGLTNLGGGGRKSTRAVLSTRNPLPRPQITDLGKSIRAVQRSAAAVAADGDATVATRELAAAGTHGKHP
eukprot:3260243-Lingulodinium_polyedra.AAC.1